MIRAFIKKMKCLNPFKKLILLFPILYFIHDIEEIITVERFLEEHSVLIPVKVTSSQFAAAFGILWVVASIGCIRAFQSKNYLGMKPVSFFSLLFPGILLANGIGHVLQFVFFLEYVPGLLTSVLIIFPYSFIALKYLLEEDLITAKKFFFQLALGFILQGPLAFAALFISKVALS
jgi:hypothetical protein